MAGGGGGLVQGRGSCNVCLSCRAWSRCMSSSPVCSIGLPGKCTDLQGVGSLGGKGGWFFGGGGGALHESLRVLCFFG